MQRIMATGLLLALLTLPAFAGDFEDGGMAYIRGDYATALKLWQPLAEQRNGGKTAARARELTKPTQIEKALDAGTLRIIILFFAGMLIQAMLLVRPNSRNDFGNLVVSILIGLAGGLVGYSDAVADPDPHAIDPDYFLMGYGFLAVAYVATQYRDRLLPKLQEGEILIWNCIFLYTIINAFGVYDQITFYAFLLSILMAIIILLPFTLPFTVKFIVYTWFLFMVVAIGALQFRFGDLGAFTGHTIKDITYSAAILDGMVFMYLGIYVMYLFLLLFPLHTCRKHLSTKDSIRAWRSNASAWVTRLSDEQVNPLLAVVLLGSLGALIYWNILTGTLEPWFLVNLLLVSTPVIIGQARGIVRVRVKTPE